MRILDASGREQATNTVGTVCIALPMPPSSFSTLWNADDRFRSNYFSEFPGFYRTGDSGYIDADGFVYVMARTDDVINVAGHRLSTGAIEEVLASHSEVAECAVIGAADPLKGQLPVGLLVLNKGSTERDRIVAECIALVRERIGPVAAFKAAVVVDRLPKTRSGKILRGTIRSIADGDAYRTPATIEDPAVLAEIGDALTSIGYPPSDLPQRLTPVVRAFVSFRLTRRGPPAAPALPRA